MNNPIDSYHFSDIGTQKAFSISSYIASFLSAIGGALTLNDIAILLGIVLALFTFAVNWIYQAKRNHREVKLNELEAQLVKAKLEKLQHDDP